MGKILEWTKSLARADSELSRLEKAWVEAKGEIIALSPPTPITDMSTLVDAVAALSSSIQNLKARNAITSHFGVPIWTDDISVESLLMSHLDLARGTETGTSQLRRAASCAIATLGHVVSTQEEYEEQIEASLCDSRQRYRDVTALFDKDCVQLVLKPCEAILKLCEIIDRQLLSDFPDAEERWTAEVLREDMMSLQAHSMSLFVAMEFAIQAMMANLTRLGTKMARQTLLSEYWIDARGAPSSRLERELLNILSEDEANEKQGQGVRGRQSRITDFYEWRDFDEVGEGNPSPSNFEVGASLGEEEKGNCILREVVSEEDEDPVEEDEEKEEEKEAEEGEEKEEEEEDEGPQQRLITSFFPPVSSDHKSEEADRR